jgi:anaerobic selenocysteine-containing dehydrogenase
MTSETGKINETTACILCSRNCGLAVTIEDGKFTRIRGDEAHPVSKGYICQKAARLEHYQHHADRLRHPLKRQPGGSFVRVSWDEALTDIARRLTAIRERHGGPAFAFYGGGGQGNHLGGMYSQQLHKAMKSRFVYSALAQEKTGDFWVNGRLFGRQTCHTTEDVEHADYVLFIGANPYQAHGIPNARDTLRDLQKDPARTMVVVDPRRSETARQADIHLPIKPGTDAFLMLAMLGIIVREGLHDREFLARHCTGFDEVERELLAVPVAEYVRRTELAAADVERVARGFATASTACVRVDLGIQHTLHTTLNGYLEKLLYLVTGNFGKRGGNNLHTFLLPLIGHSDERNPKYPRTARHRMFPIAGLYPPNILPDEIEHAGEDRVRAMFVDSANPVLTAADTQAYERSFGKLELLVVVDVAMSETARLAHYVLPAASQFEKWEATGFNLEFPENAFHLRHPLFAPLGESLPEAEIYTRLLEKMGEIPPRFPLLERIARLEPRFTGHAAFLGALAATLRRKPRWQPYAASIVYRTLGKRCPEGAAAAAPLLGLDRGLRRTSRRRRSPRRTSGQPPDAGRGAVPRHPRTARRDADEYPHLRRHLVADPSSGPAHPPGDSRNARRDARAGRGNGAGGGLSLHPDGGRTAQPTTPTRSTAIRPGARLTVTAPCACIPPTRNLSGWPAASRAKCRSATGELQVVVELDDNVRRGTATLPHGYGQRYAGNGPFGPQINRLTASAHCDPLTRTPFHKYVPVHIEPVLTAGGMPGA